MLRLGYPALQVRFGSRSPGLPRGGAGQPFLVAGDAAGFLTGSNLSINGGQHMY